LHGRRGRTPAGTGGWLPSKEFLAPEELDDANRRIGEAAGAAGRDPSRTNRVYNLVGDRSTTQRVDLLTSWPVEHGMNGYIFSGPVDESALRPIIEKVAPAVREAVANEHRR
ncbi:hypothetical protein ACFXDH_54100, partial [Streptomyces sp. NPDC059467]